MGPTNIHLCVIQRESEVASLQRELESARSQFQEEVEALVQDSTNVRTLLAEAQSALEAARSQASVEPAPVPSIIDISVPIMVTVDGELNKEVYLTSDSILVSHVCVYVCV